MNGKNDLNCGNCVLNYKQNIEGSVTGKQNFVYNFFCYPNVI